MLSGLRAPLRPLVRRVAAPIAARVSSANVVSAAAIPLALAAAAALRLQAWWLAFWLGLLAALIDLIDGTVAELKGQRSPQGNYYETMVDKAVEVIMLVGAAAAHPTATALAVGACLMVGFSKARVGLVVITDNHDWPSIGDRADRMVVFLTGVFFAGCGAGETAIGIALWIFLVVCAVGLKQRLAHAFALIAGAERDGTLLPYLRKSAPTGLTPPSAARPDGSRDDTTP